ncbi:MAG: OmpA family protein, partial [Shimia sp.]
AEVLRECADPAIEVAGHTDSQGREEMNLELSQARAEAVVTALREERILAEGLQARGYGEARPIADNDTAEGREANRRIEFTLIAEADLEDVGESADE